MKQLAQFAKFTAKPGHGDQVVAALEDASLAAAKEEGTLVYVIHVAPDNPDSVWVYELYGSTEAQLEHSGSEATARLRAAVANLLDEPITVSKGLVHKALGLSAGR
jgi:quinol monooxygenase YgiN